jgi:hypothetical protein
MLELVLWTVLAIVVVVAVAKILIAIISRL